MRSTEEYADLISFEDFLEMDTCSFVLSSVDQINLILQRQKNFCLLMFGFVQAITQA